MVIGEVRVLSRETEVEKVVYDAERLVDPLPADAVGARKIFGPHGRQKQFSQVSNGDHRKHLEQLSGGSAVVGRAYHVIQYVEFPFQADIGLRRPVGQLRISARDRG